jgi:hypothetical protein
MAQRDAGREVRSMKESKGYGKRLSFFFATTT